MTDYVSMVTISDAPTQLLLKSTKYICILIYTYYAGRA